MQKTSLICNNFSGINRNDSQFSSSIITASDMQNVELFSTENNPIMLSKPKISFATFNKLLISLSSILINITPSSVRK